MPVRKCSKTGKWKIGNGKPMYATKADAEKAQRAYLAKRGSKKKGK
jgi:hypothetical protein